MVFNCGQTSKSLCLVPCRFVGQVSSSLHCSFVGKVTRVFVNTLECCEDFKNKTLRTQLMIDWHGQGHWGNPSQKKCPFFWTLPILGGGACPKRFWPFLKSEKMPKSVCGGRGGRKGEGCCLSKLTLIFCFWHLKSVKVAEIACRGRGGNLGNAQKFFF